MKAMILFPEQVPAARRKGVEVVTTDPDVVVVSVEPWVAVTPEVWAILNRAMRRLDRLKRSAAIRASGCAGRPRIYNYQQIRDVVERLGSQRAAAEELGVARATVRRAVKEFQE